MSFRKESLILFRHYHFVRTQQKSESGGISSGKSRSIGVTRRSNFPAKIRSNPLAHFPLLFAEGTMGSSFSGGEQKRERERGGEGDYAVGCIRIAEGSDFLSVLIVLAFLNPTPPFFLFCH